MKPLDRKALIFYFLMSLILINFGKQIKILSYSPYLHNYQNSIFSIKHVYNTGGAFGIFQNSTVYLSIFGIIVAIFLFLFVFIYK